jgi:hypothetical protein
MKDLKRHRIIQDVLNKRLTSKDAAMLLSVSYRHLLRLKEKIKERGLCGILRIQNPSKKKIAPLIANEVANLYTKFYHDFNVMHFMEKLSENHKISLSYETVRQILIDKGIHCPKKRKKIHRQRRRMPKAGLLEQMDSSQHRWLEHIEDKWQLIAMIDDATNEVPYARFFPKDTLFANMHVLRRFIEIKGIFGALYVDKASHFKTTRHGGLHYNISPEQDDTQIERALGELGIDVIPANSPQAKGRIEVTFRLFQDRLIKEMRLAKIKNYDEANRFLIEKFLPWYNRRFTHEAESAYMALPKDKNLDHIFCIKKVRTVNNDNTVQFCNQVLQIPPSKIKRTFARLKVEACLSEDNKIFILYNGSVIAGSVLSKNNKAIRKEKKIETLLNNREYVFTMTKMRPRRPGRPLPLTHPWRAFRLKNSKEPLKKPRMTF